MMFAIRKFVQRTPGAPRVRARMDKTRGPLGNPACHCSAHGWGDQTLGAVGALCRDPHAHVCHCWAWPALPCKWCRLACWARALMWLLWLVGSCVAWLRGMHGAPGCCCCTNALYVPPVLLLCGRRSEHATHAALATPPAAFQCDPSLLLQGVGAVKCE